MKLPQAGVLCRSAHGASPRTASLSGLHLNTVAFVRLRASPGPQVIESVNAMHRRNRSLFSRMSGSLFFVAFGLTIRPSMFAAGLPSVVIIYADDIGYGDLSCYGARRVQTPNVDRLAQEGLRFTDAHSDAATCTPSRYALLTGSHSFRNPRARVLPGDAPALISPGTVTLASVFKQRGYATGVVGKWHLGLGDGNLNWNGEIRPGPLEIGFDYAFLMPATGDRVPCVYVENHRVVGLNPKDPIEVSYSAPIPGVLTGRDHPELLKMLPSHGHDQSIVNGISRIGYMKGGNAALWVDEDMAARFVRKALGFIHQNAARPFFLYFATHDIHVPRVPSARFRGESQMGPRGDAIVEFDWSVGEILRALENHGIARNTLVVLTSDNGPVVDDGYRDEAVEMLGDHKPAGPLRGGKYSNFEGGTRVPFIVWWPGHVKRGVSEALIGQVDLLASLAALIDVPLPPAAAPDSLNLLDTLLGKSAQGREFLPESASVVSLRYGKWKYIPPSNRPAYNKNTNTELGNSPAPQLYDLVSDIGEQRNVASEHPDLAQKLGELLEKIRSGSRTRP